MICFAETTFLRLQNGLSQNSINFVEKEIVGNKRKRNPLRPPVLSESEPVGMDELSIRCETERSESVFLGFISYNLVQSTCLLFCDSPFFIKFYL